MTEISRRHITAREAQDCLGIPASTIRVWAWRGKLHAVSIDRNGERWYRLADVLELRDTRAEWLVRHPPGLHGVMATQ